ARRRGARGTAGRPPGRRIRRGTLRTPMAHPPHSPGFLALVKDAKSRVREFTIEEYRARLARGEAWVLIDTREDHEWEAGHLPDAIHISKGIIEREIERAFP